MPGRLLKCEITISVVAISLVRERLLELRNVTSGSFLRGKHNRTGLIGLRPFHPDGFGGAARFSVTHGRIAHGRSCRAELTSRRQPFGIVMLGFRCVE